MFRFIGRWLDGRRRRAEEREQSIRSAIREMLSVRPLSGRDLRRSLRSRDFQLSRVAFYRLMARLEDEGLVESRDQTRDIDGIEVHVRFYRPGAAIPLSGRKEDSR